MIPLLWRDRQTKSPSLFVRALSPPLALSSLIPSLKAQLQSFVTPQKKEKKSIFSQDSLQGHILQPFFFGRGGAPEGTGSLVVSSHRQRPTAESIVFVLG